MRFVSRLEILVHRLASRMNLKPLVPEAFSCYVTSAKFISLYSVGVLLVVYYSKQLHVVEVNVFFINQGKYLSSATQ